MKHRVRAMLTLLLLLLLGQAFAQDTQGSLHPGGNPPFTQQELDQMLAPVALYPDPLLAQVLMAATYPLEVVEAARWSRANPDMQGDAAVRAVAGEDWDASVKSLVAFPQVLQTMDDKIGWTERLGDAFVAQQGQVMDTVQALRRRASEAGNLQSDAQMRVVQEGDDISIEPPSPDVIYVPYYDPNVVYGPWWWPYYPPIYWPAWYGYGWNGGIAWGIGFVVGVDFFFGDWDWPHRHIYDNGHGRWYGHGVAGRHPWEHAPGHRRGVPYRNDAVSRQYHRTPPPDRRALEPYRGREAPASAPQVPPGHATRGQPGRFEGRGGAFENIGHGADVRANSARGGASMGGQHAAPRTGGSGRRGH